MSMFSHSYSYEVCTQITYHQPGQDNIYNTKVNCFKIHGEVLYMRGQSYIPVGTKYTLSSITQDMLQSRLGLIRTGG